MARFTAIIVWALFCWINHGVLANDTAQSAVEQRATPKDGHARVKRPVVFSSRAFPARSEPRPNHGKALRYENLSDIEVREIERIALEINPGSIVSIGGVTVGCPCEDGANCTDQVWIVADNEVRSLGIMFSRIDGQWAVGPVQHWWLDLAALRRRFATARERNPDERYSLYGQQQEEMQQLIERFPLCEVATDGSAETASE
ncbi:MAG: hypothetical protein AB8G17_01130 [Gammaproteobacteria bacterium]